MTVTLFPSFNRATLTEDDKANPHKSAYETYTGIVFDTKKNEFNIVTGKFRDKKDMYEKMTKQDKYLRRAYESRIWDWIQKNAETPVDGYLMLSTAVSKWINNNVLSKYYKKLLHDLPYINREGRKGDPQTMGIEANFESVESNEEMILTEDFDYDLVQQNLRRAGQAGDTSKHVIKVYPVIDGQPQYNKLLRVYGGKDSKYPEEGYLYNHLLNAQVPEKANDKTKRKTELNRIFNPLIYRDIRNETMYNDGIYTPYENLAFVIDDNRSQPIIASKLALNSTAGHLENNPYQVPGKSMNTSIDTFKIANEMNIQASNEVKRLQSALEDDTLTYEERSNLERQLQAAEAKMAKTKAIVSRVGKQTSAAFNFNDETRKQLDDISMQKATVNSDSSLSDEEKANKLAELDKRAENIKADARENLYDVNNLYAKLDDIQANDNLSKEEKDKQIEDILNRIKYVQGMYYSNRNINNQERLIQQGYRLNKGEKPGNPKFGGDFEGEFISKMGDKDNIRKSLEKELNRAIKNQDVETADMIKDMLGKEDPRMFSKAEQKAAERAVEKWQAENQKAKELPQTEANVNDGATALMHATDDMAIAAQKNAIVEDKTNSELNQDLFDGKELREDVRQALLKIANEFKEKLKLPMQPDDIYFTGSEANYNYNENSDIDVHLVYDFEQVGEMAEILSKYLQSAKRIFNDSHDITVKGLSVEVGAENKAEPLVTSGIYSLISNSWVKEPENANVEIEEPDQPYLDEVKMQIEDAISEKDKDKLEGIIKMVWDIRKEGLANEGEFGPGNTLFKHLRNSGILGRLKDAYYDVESRDLSLESMLEAEFTDKNNIKVTEDDLINKSEQEIADGLMNKCSNSDEAIAKLEDVLASCNDGYKEKVKNVIQKIKESSKFGNTCRKLAEEVINKLEEYVGKNLPNMTPESYIDNMKDIAKVDEMLEFCYNEIHPNFKYKRPRLAATDENGKTIGVVLDGIESGDNPKNVLYSKVITVRDPKTGAIYPKYERNNLMPIEDFKAIIHDPRNQKWYDWVMKGQTEDWDELIAEIEARARNINEKYRRWCYDNWEKLDLLSYPPQYRVKLYDDIVHKGWPEVNAVEKWKHTKKDRFAQKIAMPKDLQGESLDEAKSDEWYLKSQNYDIIKKELDKYVPENILNVPFAIEPKAWKNQKKQNDRNREPVHYYTVVGMEKGKNPTNFLVREVTNISDDKTWKDVNDKDHAKRHDFVMNINDIMREINYSYTDASTLKLNTPEAFEQRALEMMVGGPKSNNKVNRTGTQGHWIKLTKDEVLAVLQIMEEEQPRLWKGVTKIYLNSLNKSKGEDIVMKALKAFDPNLRSSNISSIQGKPEYKLWVPKAQYDAPKKHNNNPFETLMK